MEEDSTTDAANNQADDTSNSDDTSTDSNATTDTQTAESGDNLDTSTDDDADASGGNTEDADSTTDVTPAPKFDPDLAEWAEKTGRKVPETDEDRALLQEVRDGQREFTRSKQAKDAVKDVNKAVNDAKPDAKDDEYADPLEKRVADGEARLAESEALRLRSEYVTENNVTLEESQVMAAILKEKVEKAAAVSPEKGKAAFDYWSDPANLEDWHSLAKARLASTTDNSQIEAEAARKEREKIARESKANGPARNATQTQTGAKTEDQKRLERFSNWD